MASIESGLNVKAKWQQCLDQARPMTWFHTFACCAVGLDTTAPGALSAPMALKHDSAFILLDLHVVCPQDLRSAKACATVLGKPPSTPACGHMAPKATALEPRLAGHRGFPSHCASKRASTHVGRICDRQSTVSSNQGQTHWQTHLLSSFSAFLLAEGFEQLHS